MPVDLRRGHRPVLIADQRIHLREEPKSAGVALVVIDTPEGPHEAFALNAVTALREELARVMPAVPEEVMEETPQWVWYPWRQRAVRVLGPKGFHLLRLDRNRNKITTQEQDELRQRKVGVIGLSGGHSIAYTLAQEGLCGRIALADTDSVALSDLNRIPASLLDLGSSKATMLARRIGELDPYLEVDVFHDGATAENMTLLLGGVDLVIDECDEMETKFRVRREARRIGIPVISHTSDRGMVDVERFDLESQRPLFHGMVNVNEPSELAGLATSDRAPIVLDLLEADKLSPRTAASMLETGSTVTGWPQLASDIALGSAIVASAVRRWGLGQPLPSGRLRIDLDDQLAHVPSAQTIIDLRDDALDFPEFDELDAAAIAALSDNTVEGVARAAARAPSRGNSQPWRFSFRDQVFGIHLDTERSSSTDIEHRGSLVAIGAALFNARVQAAAGGRLGMAHLPGPDLTPAQRTGEDPVATLNLGHASPSELGELSPLIELRSTERSRRPTGPIPDNWITTVGQVTRQYGVNAYLLRGAAMEDIQQIWAASDRLQLLDEDLRAEMLAEMTWPNSRRATGVDVRSLGLDPAEEAELRLCGRGDTMSNLSRWEAGSRLGDLSRSWLAASEGLVVLIATGNEAGAYVAGGQCLQHLWLSSEEMGVAIHPMSPPWLYANNADEARTTAPADTADLLWSLRVKALDRCSIPPGAPLLTTFRVTKVEKSAYRSRREAVAERWIERTPRLSARL